EAPAGQPAKTSRSQQSGVARRAARRCFSSVHPDRRRCGRAASQLDLFRLGTPLGRPPTIVGSQTKVATPVQAQHRVPPCRPIKPPREKVENLEGPLHRYDRAQYQARLAQRLRLAQTPCRSVPPSAGEAYAIQTVLNSNRSGRNLLFIALTPAVTRTCSLREPLR